jgi:TRAP-type C4-dicarboxylate transport system permease small subunit
MRWQANLVNLARRTESVLNLTSKVAAYIASFVLGAMTLLTTADVIGRYFFSKPIPGTWELVGLLLVFAGTWGWGYCQKEKMHVSVTVITDHFPRMVKLIFGIVTYLLGLAAFSLMCWRMWVKTINYFSMGSRGLTQTLEIPFYPFMLALAISAGIMALILLIDLLHYLAEVVRK